LETTVPSGTFIERISPSVHDAFFIFLVYYETAEMPLLSIIIPVYNSENTIGRTLNSLERMSFESRALTEVLLLMTGQMTGAWSLLNRKRKVFHLLI